MSFTHPTSYRTLTPSARRPCQATRGFRLNPRRLSIKGLRARFVCLFKALSRWRFSYGRALRALRKGISVRSSKGNGGSGSRRWLVREDCSSSSSSSSSTRNSTDVCAVRYDCRLRYLGRSNSFYSEAIADCLEFIKRSSISVDQIQIPKSSHSN